MQNALSMKTLTILAMLVPALTQCHAPCGDKDSCGVYQPPPGSAGAVNAGGEAGMTSAGGTAGSAGTGGSNAGSSGTGTSGGAPPCDGTCTGGKPVCDANTMTCVECTKTTHCRAPKPVCDLGSNTCVECLANSDCKDTSRPLCDTKTRLCVACLSDTDCKDASAAHCAGGMCAACDDTAQCKHIAGKGLCDKGPGQCVQCTGADYSACGKDKDGNPLVCDSLAHTCSATAVVNGAGLCAPCVSDAQCVLGEMCVLEKFKSKDVGYFCHWKQGDTTHGAPADCTATGQPYVGLIESAKSIDGQTSDVCVLATSTCVARNDFRKKDCAPSASPDDTLCGFSPPDDAKCAKFGSTTFRCTMRCLSDDDCPGTVCDTGLAQPVCKLQ